MSENTSWKEDSSHSNPSDQTENPKIVSPPFVLIDDRNGETQQTYFNIDSTRTSSESFQEGETISLKSTSLRFACLLGLIFCLIFGLGMMIGSILLSILAILSFFKNETLNYRAWGCWKISFKTLCIAFGLAVGILFPQIVLNILGFKILRS